MAVSMGMGSVEVEWTVKNFSTLGSGCVQSYDWASFGSSEWMCTVFPKCGGLKGEEFVSVELINRCLSLVPSARVSIVNMFNDSCYTSPWTRLEGWRTSFPKLISRRELVGKGLLVNDELRIKCVVDLRDPPEHDQGRDEAQEADEPLQKSVSEVFNLKEVYSDLTVNVGEEKFPVHKFILATQSDVFAAMFRHDMKESMSSEVTIEDCNPAVFGEFLSFLYSKRVRKLSLPEYMELLACAHKYSVGGLKDVCSKAMRKELSIRNAVDMLLSAEKYTATGLTKDVVKFIATFLARIEATPGFDRLSTHPSLLMDVIKCIAVGAKNPKLPEEPFED